MDGNTVFKNLKIVKFNYYFKSLKWACQLISLSMLAKTMKRDSLFFLKMVGQFIAKLIIYK